jgi:hypothetical protein
MTQPPAGMEPLSRRQAIRDVVFAFQCTHWDAGAKHDLSEAIEASLEQFAPTLDTRPTPAGQGEVEGFVWAKPVDGELPYLPDGKVYGWRTIGGTIYMGDGYPVPARKFSLDASSCEAVLVLATLADLRGGVGETLEAIVAWGDDTFGPCSAERSVNRAWEEWREMQGEEPGSEQHAIEVADVIICLLRVPGILDAINAKMAKNRSRTWKVMGDGTGYHVKPDGRTSAPKPTPALDRGAREAIARIVDPKEWHNYDGLLRVAENYPITAAASKAEADRAVAPSLAKADAILALTASPPDADAQREIERLRALLVDPGTPPWENARAVLVAEMRKGGYCLPADYVEQGKAAMVPSHIALNLIALASKSSPPDAGEVG